MTPKPKLPEFIFGELSTPAGRLKRVIIARLGLYHESMLTPLDPGEYEPIQVTVRVGAEISVKAVTLYYTTDGTVPQIQSAPDHPSIVTLPMERTTIEWDTLHWCYLEQWTVQIPGQVKGTHVQYAIAATTTTEKIIFCPYIDLDTLENQENLESFGIKDFKDFPKIFRTDNQPQIYGFYVDGETIPQWLREAVIYEIFVDRFAPDPGREFANPENRSGFYGGTLKGIISKLDYLRDFQKINASKQRVQSSKLKIAQLENKIRMLELSDSLKSLLIETANNLKNHQRRRFMAQTVKELGLGGQRLAERELGWNRDLIRKGTREVESGIVCLDANHARGRKRVEADLPNLLEDLKSIVDSQSQIDPSFKSNRLYTKLSVAEVVRQLMEQKGYSIYELPCHETIRSRLNDLGYYPKKVAKTKPKKKFLKPMLSLNN